MTKGIYPGAIARLIPPGSNDPAITPRIAILHVDAGNAESLYEFFKDRSGGIESHFHVRKDGSVEQYRNIFWQADANLDANDFAVSIETQGYGAGKWTVAQLAAIKKLLLWLNKEAGIPLEVCQKWDGKGVGYHTMFGSPSHWTPVAKSCPGPDRKVQFEQVLTPWLKKQSAPEPKPTPRWDSLVEQIDSARKLAKRILADAPADSQKFADAERVVTKLARAQEIAKRQSAEY